MNLKLVLRTYSALRQLTDDESALLNTLRVMNDSERELLVESLQPEKVVMKRAGRKPRIPLCLACDYAEKSIVHKDNSLKDYHQFQPPRSASKSPRASGMAAAINRSLSQQRRIAKDGDDQSSALPDSECRFVINDATGETCGAMTNDPIHDMRYLSSHEFESGKSLAQPVVERSSTNGGEAQGANRD